MALQDCKCPIDLLQQDDPCQFVRQGHLAERKYQVCGPAGSVAEPIRRADGEEQVLRAAILLVAQQLGKLFRGKLPPPGIKQDQDWRGAAAPGFGQLQQRCLGGQFMRLCSQISRDAVEIFAGQRANRRFLGLADPGNLKFHRNDCKCQRDQTWRRYPMTVRVHARLFFRGLDLKLMPTLTIGGDRRNVNGDGFGGRNFVRLSQRQTSLPSLRLLPAGCSDLP